MNTFEQAAETILNADGLLITAGAGLGVDSGLPDFRGNNGFWQAYPALGNKEISFSSIASPAAFKGNARQARGFYGHRLNLYRKTVPHAGFEILKQIGASRPKGSFVFTSNVDGQFQMAGFRADQVAEVHGSIHDLQCVTGCLDDIWPADGFEPKIDAENCLITSPFPTCPHCGALARPNILMFGDWQWLEHRSAGQRSALGAWLSQVEQLVIIELGAGTSIPTVRRVGDSHNGTLIRINPREADVSRPGDISIACGALEALTQIQDRLPISLSSQEHARARNFVGEEN